jgi:hypothetical protein
VAFLTAHVEVASAENGDSDLPEKVDGLRRLLARPEGNIRTGMEPYLVIETLDEAEDIPLGIGAGLGNRVDEFGLRYERSSLSVRVVTIGFAAHRWGDAGGREGTAIGV